VPLGLLLLGELELDRRGRCHGVVPRVVGDDLLLRLEGVLLGEQLERGVVQLDRDLRGLAGRDRERALAERQDLGLLVLLRRRESRRDELGGAEEGVGAYAVALRAGGGHGIVAMTLPFLTVSVWLPSWIPPNGAEAGRGRAGGGGHGPCVEAWVGH